MFLLGHQMQYGYGVRLNEISVGRVSGARRDFAASRRVNRLRGSDGGGRAYLDASAAVGSAAVKSEIVSEVASELVSEVDSGMERHLPFIVEPLTCPCVVRPHDDPHVLYVRLACHVHSARPETSRDSVGDHVAVMPDPARAIRAEIAAAHHAGQSVRHAVLVGADALMDPRAWTRPGHSQALAQLVEALGALATAGIPFVWRTRGGIDGVLPQQLTDVLAAAGSRVVVELGIPTLDEGLCAALEGGAGVAPMHRLRFAAALHARGIPVRGLVDPLVPMLTDQEHMLDALLGALSEAGVARIGGRYVVLTRERARTLARRLVGMQRALLEGVFAEEPWHEAAPAWGVRDVHKRIPAHLRRAGHHRLVEAGGRYGIRVDVLDPVLDGEDLTGRDEEGPRGRASRSRPARRSRPQMELFVGSAAGES